MRELRVVHDEVVCEPPRVGKGRVPSRDQVAQQRYRVDELLHKVRRREVEPVWHPYPWVVVARLVPVWRPCPPQEGLEPERPEVFRLQRVERLERRHVPESQSYEHAELLKGRPEVQYPPYPHLLPLHRQWLP